MKDDKSGGDTDVLGISTNQNIQYIRWISTLLLAQGQLSMMHYGASTIIPTAEPEG